VVERRVDLIEDAERARAEVEDGEQKGQSSEGALTAREQRDRLEPLAPRLRHELNAGIEWITSFFRLDEAKLRAASFEQAFEDLREVLVDLLEGLDEAFLSRVRHSSQRLLQILDGRGEVVVLRAQERQSLVELAILLVGHEVDGADRGEPLRELAQSLTE